jgi:hypothetical protein
MLTQDEQELLDRYKALGDRAIMVNPTYAEVETAQSLVEKGYIKDVGPLGTFHIRVIKED